jgi:hypothetical protein
MNEYDRILVASARKILSADGKLKTGVNLHKTLLVLQVISKAKHLRKKCEEPTLSTPTNSLISDDPNIVASSATRLITQPDPEPKPEPADWHTNEPTDTGSTQHISRQRPQPTLQENAEETADDRICQSKDGRSSRLSDSLKRKRTGEPPYITLVVETVTGQQSVNESFNQKDQTLPILTSSEPAVFKRMRLDLNGLDIVCMPPVTSQQTPENNLKLFSSSAVQDLRLGSDLSRDVDQSGAAIYGKPAPPACTSSQGVLSLQPDIFLQLLAILASNISGERRSQQDLVDADVNLEKSKRSPHDASTTDWSPQLNPTPVEVQCR